MRAVEFFTNKVDQQSSWPREVIARLDYFEDKASAAHGAYNAHIDRQSEQGARVYEAEKRRNRFTGAKLNREEYAETVSSLDKAIEREKKELSRLRVIGNQLRDDYQLWKGLETKTRKFMGSVSLSALRLAKPLKLPKGKKIETVRAEIEALSLEVEKIASSPLPSSELRRRAHQHIDIVAQRGEPTVYYRTDRSPVDLSTLHPHFLVWLVADEIKNKIDALIGPDRPGALSEADRKSRLSELSYQKLNLERVEEALILHEETEGRAIPRRPDASVEAILGIEVIGAYQ